MARRPDPLRLAKDAWALNWVLGYFVALAAIRVIMVFCLRCPLTAAMAQGIPFLFAGGIVALTFDSALPRFKHAARSTR